MVFDHVTRRFGSTTALDQLSLDIAPGELVALLGPSGCGKTTALRVLAGFERPDIGHVMVDGKDVSHVPAQRRDMGMVFQSYSLFPNMNARDNVAFGLQIRHERSSQRRAKAGELLGPRGSGRSGDEISPPDVRWPATARRAWRAPSRSSPVCSS